MNDTIHTCIDTVNGKMVVIIIAVDIALILHYSSIFIVKLVDVDVDLVYRDTGHWISR